MSSNLNQIEIMDCPICMEAINGLNNKVSTECGHCFHTNCLMKSVVHNGFGCPYCRTVMAETPKEDEDEESVWSDEEDEEEMFDDYALRGLRFFFNNLNHVEHDSEDLEDEEEVEQEQEQEPEQVQEPVPSVRYVTHTLIRQGVTMENLVAALLSGHDEYIDNEDLERTDDFVFGQFRIAISNWSPSDEPIPIQEETQEEHQVASAVEKVDENINTNNNSFILVDTQNQPKKNNGIKRLALSSKSIYGVAF